MLTLLGVLVVIIGFAMKKDALLIVLVSALVTAITGKLGLQEFLDVIGKTFVFNRTMAIFILILLVTGTLERNGLKEVAAKLIGKIKNATPTKVLAAYGIMRIAFAAFNINFGGVAGFVRPIIYPMAVGAVEGKHGTINPEHQEEVKAMSAAIENVAWFFGQVLFVGGSGALLVRATLNSLGYEVELLKLAKVEIPVAIFALIVSIIICFFNEKKLTSKFYSKKKVD